MAELGSEPRACFTYYAIVSQLMQTVTSQTQRNRVHTHPHSDPVAAWPSGTQAVLALVTMRPLGL